MLARLLESQAMRSRSPIGTMTSVAAHFVLIILAVHATAQTRTRTRDEAKLIVVRFAPQRRPTTPTEPTATTSPPMPHRLPLPSFPIFDPKLAPIDIPMPSPVEPADFLRGEASLPPVTERGKPVADSGTTFRSDQVERQVAVSPGAPLPRYPEALRSAGVEGRVIAEFVVNELGRVEADSVRFVTSDNVLFEESVRNTLQRMRFTPAQIGGRNVRQLVRMPFVFTLGGR